MNFAWLVDECQPQGYPNLFHLPVRRQYKTNSFQTALFPFCFGFLAFYLVKDVLQKLYLDMLMAVEDIRSSIRTKLKVVAPEAPPAGPETQVVI